MPRVESLGRLARAAALVAVGAVIVAVCITAGLWQWQRHTDRVAQLDQFELNTSREPLTVEDLTAISPPADATWRSVTATGTLDTEVTVLRNRPVDSRPAEHVIAWLATEVGSMAINLGHHPAGEDPPATLPSGTVSVVVLWRDWEEDDGRSGPGATRITPAQLDAPPDALDGYGMLLESPATLSPSALGLEPAPVPRLTRGPHLAYAWQWWIFALMAPVGLFHLSRRERGPSPRAPESAQPSAPRRRLSDEEVEDALIDAQVRTAPEA